MTVDTSVPVSVAASPPVVHERDCPPSQTSIQDVVERPVEYPLIQFVQSASQGDIIDYFDPVRFLLSNTNVAAKLQGYQNFRFGVKLRFELTGSAFFSGKLRAFWVPLNRVGQFTSHMFTLAQISSIQEAVDLYPIEHMEAELTIRPLLPLRYWSGDSVGTSWDNLLTDGPNKFYTRAQATANSAVIAGPNPSFVSAGFIAFCVIAPLTGMNPADTCTIKTFLSITDLEIDCAFASISTVYWPGNLGTVRAPFGNPMLTRVPGGNSYTKIFVASQRYQLLRGIAPTFASDVDKEDTGTNQTPEKEAKSKGKVGFWTLGTRTIADIITVFTPLTGAYAPFTMAAGLTVRGLSAVLGYFKLDKPREMVIPRRMLGSYKNLTYGSGVEESQMLALDPANAVMPLGLNQPFQPCGADVGCLAAIPALLWTTTLTSAMAAGTSMLAWAVAPWNVYSEVILIGPARPRFTEGTIHPTSWSWLTAISEYWRGDCVIDLEVIAPAFAKTTLLLSWEPGDPETLINYPVAAHPDAVQNTHNQIVRVSGTTRARFVIPYRSHMHACNSIPTRYTPFGSFTDNLQALTRQQSFNGGFFITLLQPLTQYSPAGALVSPVTVLVSVSWPGLQLFRPSAGSAQSAPACGMNVGPLLPEAKTHAQGSESPSEFVHLERPTFASDVVSVHANTLGLSPTHFFGELIHSIIPLCKRPGVLSILNGNANNPVTLAIKQSLFNFPLFISRQPLLEADALDRGAAITDLEYPFSYAAWFSKIFLTSRGEVTYTVIPRVQSGQAVLYPAAGADDNGSVRIANVALYPRSMLATTNNLAPYDTSLGYSNTYSGDTNALAAAMLYRPAMSGGIPATAVAPYWSMATFQLTPDQYWRPGIATPLYYQYNLNIDIPGVEISVAAAAGTSWNILASAGDNFSFGGFYPPCADSFFSTDGIINRAVAKNNF